MESEEIQINWFRTQCEDITNQVVYTLLIFYINILYLETFIWLVSI